MLNRRHRRAYYSVAQSSLLPSIIKRAVILLLLGIVLFSIASKVLSLFGVGNVIRRHAVILGIEGQGTVSISIEGKNLKRAEDQLKLYPGDSVQTSGNAQATLLFFDGTLIRLNEHTNVFIDETAKGDKKSEFNVKLSNGSVWIATPTIETYSGSIIRNLSTENMSINIPSRTEALLTTNSLTVFSADYLGIKVSLLNSDKQIYIGEGQKIIIPENINIIEDPYRYRSPIDPLIVQSSFVEESRISYAKHLTNTKLLNEEKVSQSIDDDPLVVIEPKNNMLTTASTIRIVGSVGSNVKSVKINGYLVDIDKEKRKFEKDISLPDEDQTSILIEAIAEDGTVISEIRRIVKRDRKPPSPPIIISPAGAGKTYLTSREDIEIIGKVTNDIVGVLVNDYRLQLFQPGDDSWTYLASTKLGNFKPGENIYQIVAINKGGYKSEPAVITIILGEGEEGIIEETDNSQESENKNKSDIKLDSDNLSQNFPLMPGTLKVTAPTAGSFHSATGSSFLIEGTTSTKTNSIWVNGYRLRLYKPGKDFWNYIADTNLGTLKRGKNIYRITARNSEGKILDKIEYTVRFNPRR